MTYVYTGDVPEGAPTVPASAEYVLNQPVTIEAGPTLDGWEFSGWTIDGGPAEDFKMPSKDVTITGSWSATNVDDISVVGYEGEYDGQSHGVTVSGALEGDVISYAVDGEESNNAFTDVFYANDEDRENRTESSITVTATVTRDGIEIWSGDADVLITPASITVTANNQTKVQGTADPALTTRYTKAVGNEVPGWAGSVTRDPGEAPGTYDITQGSLKLADGSNGFLAGNYELTFVPGTLTITPAPVTPGGGDDGPTPGGGGDTPTPAPVPDPVPADDATDDDTEAEEAIDDDTTPLVSPTEAIDDGDTPLAAGRHEDCWVHWIILIGMILSSVYFVGVSVRRRKFTSSLLGYEKKVLDNDRDDA